MLTLEQVTKVYRTRQGRRQVLKGVSFNLGRGENLGIRQTLADMGQTIAENFGGAIPHGKSFLWQIASR